jgi:hypothetical protein
MILFKYLKSANRTAMRFFNEKELKTDIYAVAPLTIFRYKETNLFQ